MVQHHVDEEEDQLLPRVERGFDDEMLEALGRRMEDRFAEALRGDFRKPLQQNLRRVLAGRTKTTPKPRRARVMTRATARKRGRKTGRASRASR